MKFQVLLLFLSIYFTSFSRGNVTKESMIDSLLVELEKSKEELGQNKLKVKLGELYLNIDNKKAESYSLEAYKYGSENNNLEIRKSASYTLAHVYNGIGKYATAIEYFIESDELCHQANDTIGMILCQNGLGNLHLGDNNFDQALKHFTNGNELSKFIKDTINEGITYMGMGNAISKLGDNEQALVYFEEAKKIYNKGKNIFIYASILANMAETYSELGQIDKALKNNFEALEVMTDLNHRYGIAILNQNIGVIYKKLERYDKALTYYEKAININIEIGALDALQVCYFDFGEIQEELGNTSLAYDYMKKHISIKDSLFTVKNSEIVAEMQKKYDQEINDNKIILLSKENEIGARDLKAKENQQLYLFGSFIIVLLFLGFLYSRFKITNNQKRIIEQVNNDLNHTNLELGIQRDEILASITYAKRIQNAILPPSKIVKEHLKDSFILYKPKDIVAGDFYWLERKNGVILFAAADCTGHGVPGAMVSVICNNALNRSVREYGILDPGNILDKSREIVIEEFEKSEEEVKDGMDIALCSIQGTQLKYAGAHNPLWIIREGEILETKGDKQPIGKFDNHFLFKTHTFDLQKGDSIYVFTDGFVDQFGGEKGKKFKTKAFRELLLSIQENTMEVQKQILNDTFEKWKSNFEQIDDVCVMGVKF